MRRLWVFVALAASAALVAIAVAAIVKERDDQDVIADAPAPAACEPEAQDQNPSDERIEPSRGEPLITRNDGRLPVGFNDASHLRGWVTLDEALELYELAAMSLTRMALDWGAVELSPGELDFSQYDEIYCTALAAGVRPVWTLTGIPDWTAPLGTCGDPCVRPPEEEHLPQLQRFAELAAIRYPRSAAFEAWNEPNLGGYWAGSPNPGEYLAVLEAIYTGTKNGNPAMPVLGGSLSNNPTDGTIGLSLRTFLDGMMAGGATRFMDGISVHVYPIQPIGHEGEQFTPAMAITRELLASQGGGVRIWVTEVGASTEEGAFSPMVSPAQQAAILSEVYQQLDNSDDVDAVLFHSLMDVREGDSGQPGFGFFTQPDDDRIVTVKPVVCAVRTLIGMPADECPTQAQL